MRIKFTDTFKIGTSIKDIEVPKELMMRHLTGIDWVGRRQRLVRVAFGECAMTPRLSHVREPAGEPDVCSYCCEEWMDLDPADECPLRVLGLPTLRELRAIPHHYKEKA